jgi:hypothetical protein
MTSEIESLSREFAKLTGIEWHEVSYKVDRYMCSCGASDPHQESNDPMAAIRNFMDAHSNPDFTDAREVIKVLDEIGRLDEFVVTCGALGKHSREDDLIPVRYVKTPGLMLAEAVTFMKGEKE